MKKSTHPAMAAVAALAVACSPLLFAQQSTGPDQSQNPRANDSTADQHAAQTGSMQSLPPTLNKNNSKDAASESRDSNPGTANSDSANRSATKDPNTPNTSGKEPESNGLIGSNSQKESQKSAAEKPLSDQDFMTKAAQGGMTEVQLGKVAGERGNSSQVKEFGARMVKDHTAANDELKGIAEKKGVTLASSLDSMHQAKVDKLSKLNGPAFDKAYVSGMVSDHEKTVKLFKDEAKSGQDPDIKAFAEKTLPTLESHCSSIMDIQKSGVK